MATTRQPRYGDIFAGHDEGASMAEYARVLWAEYKADLEGRDLWNVVRAKMVDRLVRSVVEYDQIYPIAAATGPVTIGPNGGEVFSFHWSAVHKLNDKIMKLEKALTLSPESIGDKTPGKRKDGAPKAAAKYLGRAAH